MNTPRPLALPLIILTNAIPLIGVLIFGWELRSILLLYWAENIILGAATLLKIFSYFPPDAQPLKAKLFLGAFFTVHFGIFCFVHLIFLLVLSSTDLGATPTIPDLSNLGRGIIYALLSMVAFQIYDYYTSFIQSGKYRHPGIEGKIVSAPYKHIVVIHIAIIFGAIIAVFLGTPIAILLIIIAGKTITDLRAEKSKTNP